MKFTAAKIGGRFVCCYSCLWFDSWSCCTLHSRTEEKKGKSDVESKYDRDAKALIFSATASAADRALTAEEVAAKEKSRLEALEHCRVKRMKGDVDSEPDDIIIMEGAVQPKCGSSVYAFYMLDIAL